MTSAECQNIMFKNKNADETLNLCGNKITELRKKMKLSQRALADQMQLQGLDLNKNAIQQIESGRRFVTDLDLVRVARLG